MAQTNLFNNMQFSVDGFVCLGGFSDTVGYPQLKFGRVDGYWSNLYFLSTFFWNIGKLLWLEFAAQVSLIFWTF